MRNFGLFFLFLFGASVFARAESNIKRPPQSEIATYSTRDNKITLSLSNSGEVSIRQKLAPDSLAVYKWQEKVILPEDVIIAPKLSYVFMFGDKQNPNDGRGRIRVYNFQGSDLRSIQLSDVISDFDDRARKCGKSNKWYLETKLIASTDRVMIRLCDRKAVYIPLASLSPEWN